jgi:mRNA interferase RelE/StbE
MYEVLLSDDALRTYHRAQPPLARKLNRCFENLSLNPRSHPNIKPLSGQYAGCWRYRAGDWRIVYGVDDGRRQVLILSIMHRREVYR